MKTPIIDIKHELHLHGETLKRNYFAIPMDTFAIETRTFGGNTARAFQIGRCYNNYTPSSIFKNWVHHDYIGNPKIVEMLKEDTDFFEIHSQAIQGLRNRWHKLEPKATGIVYYHFAKMVDLLFKSIPRWSELEPKRQEWFFQRVHVPIDKYSLRVLTEVHSGYDIPNPSMNYIGDSKERYDKVQADISEMIAPFPPMLFDLYAWDHRRRDQLRIDEKFELIPVS